jgi:hypothetical protein
MNEEQRLEYEAWKSVARCWPGDINDQKFNNVLKAIRVWGERLSALRRTQPSETVDRARLMVESRL